MSKYLIVIIPAFGFRKKSDTEVYEYAVLRKGDLVTNAGVFGAVEPSTADLDVQINAYADALATFRPGDKHSTRVKNGERRKLETMLTEMAWSCAVIAVGDFTVYSLSGFGAKQKGVPHTSLDTPVILGMFDGPVPETLQVKFKSVKYKKLYEIQVSTDDSFADGPATKVYLVSAGPFVIADLQSEVRYYVRVRAIGVRCIKSDWSLMANRRVQ